MNLDENLIISKYILGQSCNSLGQQYGCSAVTIYKLLTNNGVQLRKKWEHKTLKVPKTELSDYQKQIIEGCLLGDGSV